MTPRDFCYWLQGYFEVSNAKELTEEQVKMVKRHLNLVFHSQPVISASYALTCSWASDLTCSAITESKIPWANWTTCSLSSSNEGCSPVDVDINVLVDELERLGQKQEQRLKENDLKKPV